MSFEEGMRLFRSGDVPGACEQFHQAVEQDENNHKAWNALGICLSKTGEHEDADTCFENALMLDPGNATYERNREKNSLKIPIRRPEKKPTEPVRSNTRREYDSGYQRNWLQVPLYFIPMILLIANPIVGFLAVIACAYYIKRDAESLNAGMNPDASVWGKMKGWEWMLLLVLFWILLPLYSWKREQIYEENLEYGPDRYSGPPQSAEDSMWKYVKVGGAAVIVILLLFLISSTMNPSYQNSFNSGYNQGLKESIGNDQPVDMAAHAAPIVNQPQRTIDTSTPTPAPTPIELHGWGKTATDPIELKRGLAKVQMDHYGERNFIVFLLDMDGNKIELLMNEIGPAHGSKAIRVPRNGKYLFDIEAGGEWSIKVTQ